MKNLVIVLVAFLRLSIAQIPNFGDCPNVTVKSDFNQTQFLGKWYEAEKIFMIPYILAKCVTAEYSMGENDTMIVTNSQIDSILQSKSEMNISIQMNILPNMGQMSINLPYVPFSVSVPYDILETDYINYAVIYSCMDIIGNHAKLLWILTRTRFPSSEIMNTTYKVLEKNGLDTSLSKTDQWNCPMEH